MAYKDPKIKKEISKRYYDKHRSEVLARAKLRYNSKAQKEYYLKNKDRIISTASKYYVENEDKVKIRMMKYRTSIESRLRAVRFRAAKNHLDFDLTLEWAESLPLICFYSGRHLTLNSNLPDTASFERVNNSKGYTQDNAVLCSKAINYMKKAMSKDEFIKICKDIVDHQNKNNPELL